MTNPYEASRALAGRHSPGSSEPERMRTSNYAIASLVFAVVPCCIGLGGIVAIVLGWVALRQIKAEPARFSGNGLAWAGIVLGLVGVLVVGAGTLVASHRYHQLKPVAESFTRQMISGDVKGAHSLFVMEFRKQPGSVEQLVQAREQLQMGEWGDLTSLEWSWSFKVTGDVTTVTFEAVCTHGSAPMQLHFTKEKGLWRLLRFHILPFRSKA